MKFLTLGLLCSLFMAFTPDSLAGVNEEITAGRAALVSRKLADADAAFTRAVAADASHPEANVWKAITRILVLQTKPQANAILDKLGVTKAGRNLFAWKAKAPKKITGSVTSDNLEDYGITQLRPELVAAVANLAKVNSPTFELTLDTTETALPSVTLDYGDVLFVKAFLSASIATLDVVDSQQTNVKVSDIALWISNHTLSVEQVLIKYPALLTPEPSAAGKLVTAKTAFQDAVSTYLSASEFIRARADSEGRLIVIDPEYAGAEERLRGEFEKVSQSFAGVVAFDTRTQVFAGAYLTSTVTLRSLLPGFAKNHVKMPAGVPEATFAGVLPGLAKARADEFFEKLGEDLDNLTGYQVDPAPPTLKIVSPKAKAKVLAVDGEPDRITIKGTALDKGGIEWVEIDPSSGPRLHATLSAAPAGSPAGTIAWEAVVDVEPGLNDFRVQAMDSDGNLSTFAWLQIDYVKYSNIAVSVTGSGTAKPGTAKFKIGTTQIFTAKPAAGFILRDWTFNGQSVGSALKLSLEVEDEPTGTLVANFISNPFPERTGTYNIVFKDEIYDEGSGDLVSRDFQGLATLTLTKTGAYTAKINIGGKTYSGKGVLDGSGRALLQFKAKGKPTVTIQFTLKYDGDMQYLDVFFDDGDGEFVYGYIPAYAQPTVSARYNMSLDYDPTALLPSNDVPDTLLGSSIASLVRDASGDCRLVGTMADGTKFSYGGRPFSDVYDFGGGDYYIDTKLEVYVLLNTKGQRLAGSLSFMDSTNPSESPLTVSGDLEWNWVKPTSKPLFANDFLAQLVVTGGVYTAPAKNAILPPFDASGGFLTVSDDVNLLVDTSFTLNIQNKATMELPNPQKVTLKFDPASGTFSGSFVTPAPGSVTRTFSGIVIPDLSGLVGFGFSLGAGASNSVVIQQ